MNIDLKNNVVLVRLLGIMIIIGVGIFFLANVIKPEGTSLESIGMASYDGVKFNGYCKYGYYMGGRAHVMATEACGKTWIKEMMKHFELVYDPITKRYQCPPKFKDWVYLEGSCGMTFVKKYNGDYERVRPSSDDIDDMVRNGEASGSNESEDNGKGDNGKEEDMKNIILQCMYFSDHGTHWARFTYYYRGELNLNEASNIFRNWLEGINYWYITGFETCMLPRICKFCS